MNAHGILGSAPTPDGVPWRKVVIGGVITAVLTVMVGVGGTKAIESDRDARFEIYRERCAARPEGVVPAITAGLADLEGRTVRGVGATLAVEGDLAGSWFVSLELAAADIPRGLIGDVATFLVADAAGGPGTADIQAVGSDAERYSSWPVAEGVLIDVDGGVESRWCAADDGPGVLHN